MEEEAFQDVAVQTLEYHYPVAVAFRDEVEAGQAFPAEAEQAVLSSSARAEAAPSASAQTEAEDRGTAAAALHLA